MRTRTSTYALHAPMFYVRIPPLKLCFKLNSLYPLLCKLAFYR